MDFIIYLFLVYKINILYQTIYKKGIFENFSHYFLCYLLIFYVNFVFKVVFLTKKTLRYTLLTKKSPVFENSLDWI
jgi:hypothetical protein